MDYFVDHLRGTAGMAHLQPLVPAVTETIRHWCSRVPGHLMVLHDHQNLLSDQMIAGVRREMRNPSPLVSIRPAPVAIGAFVRGDSESHSSIQLPDLVAGAARVAGEYALGRRTDPVAKQLSDAVRPLIVAGSLWGDSRSWPVLSDLPY